MAFVLALEARVMDKVTGFSGTIVSRCDSMSSVNNYLVQPELDLTDHFMEPRWFDEDRLSIMDATKEES